MTNFTSTKQITGKRIWYRDQYTDKTAYQTICSAKSRLLVHHPFWGMTGLDLVLVEAPHSSVRTLATDGYHIFYSAAFVNSLRLDEVVFGVAHEIFHCIFGHTEGATKLRRKHADWDAKRWNRACDYVINADLKKSGVGEFITTIKILYDPKFDGMGSEEVYLALKDSDPMPDCDTLDVHVDFELDDGSPSEGGDQDADSPGSSPGGAGDLIVVKVSQDYLDNEAVRWEQIAQRAVAQVLQGGQDAGSIPANLLRIINDLNKPKVHWTSVLRKFVVSVRSVGYSYLKPDRRTFGGDFVFPSFRRDSQKLVLAVAIDTSGSIGDEALRKFLSELVGILKAYKSYEVHVFCFEGDVDPSTYEKITHSGSSVREKIIAYIQKVAGGGGTCFQSVWDFLRMKKIKPRGLIFFTDGGAYDTSWHNERGIPTLFVTLDNPKWKAPFGVTIPFEKL